MEEISGEVKQQLSSNLSSPNGISMVMMTPAGSFHPARLLPPPLPFPLLSSRPSLYGLFPFLIVSSFLLSSWLCLLLTILLCCFSVIYSSSLCFPPVSSSPLSPLYFPSLHFSFSSSSPPPCLRHLLYSFSSSLSSYFSPSVICSFLSCPFPVFLYYLLLSLLLLFTPHLFIILLCSLFLSLIFLFFQFAFPITFFTSLLFLCLFTFLSSLLTPPFYYIFSSIFSSLLPFSLWSTIHPMLLLDLKSSSPPPFISHFPLPLLLPPLLCSFLYLFFPVKLSLSSFQFPSFLSWFLSSLFLVFPFFLLCSLSHTSSHFLSILFPLAFSSFLLAFPPDSIPPHLLLCCFLSFFSPLLIVSFLISVQFPIISSSPRLFYVLFCFLIEYCAPLSPLKVSPPTTSPR